LACLVSLSKCDRIGAKYLILVFVEKDLPISALEFNKEGDAELTREKKVELLKEFGFVRIEGGRIIEGTDTPLVSKLEGRRWNETPPREIAVTPFWICRTKVVNAWFEEFNPDHKRSLYSLENSTPVVDVTYYEALAFCRWLNRRTRMDFRLPTEPEWTKAAAPSGWWFVYKKDMEPKITQAHTFNDGHENKVVAVLDPRWPSNFLGLDQMGHNVSEFTLGHYRIKDGNWGAADDGMYCIARGGNWGACPYSARVNRRMIVDVLDRNPRVGFRLVHDDV
jgi:formylglycine-generating enzyme